MSEAEGFFHLLADLGEAVEPAAADFCGGPACPVGVGDGLADVGPWEVVVVAGDFGEGVLGAAEAFDVEFDGAWAEGADPFAGLAVFPVVTDVVVLADPWAFEAVDELDVAVGGLFRAFVVIVHHLVPDIFEEDALAEGGGEGDAFGDFDAGAGFDFFGWAVAAFADDDEDAGAAGGVGAAETVVHVGAGFVADLLFGVGEAGAPVFVIDGVVDEDPGGADGFADLVGGEAAGFVEVDPVEAGFCGGLETFDDVEGFTAFAFAGDHAELAGEEDAAGGFGEDDGGGFGFFGECGRGRTDGGGGEGGFEEGAAVGGERHEGCGKLDSLAH